jgi:AraC-like DNA-binding protein
MNDMVSIDIQEIADGSFLRANGQLQSVGVNPNYGSGYLSKIVSFQNGISIVIGNFSLYGDGEIRVFPEKENPPVIEFFTFFSGVGHISYAKPRVHLGDGFSNIEFPGYMPGLSMEVKRNTPIQAFAVCMDPVGFEKLTGKRSNELAEALDYLDRSVDKRNRLTRLKSIDLAQKVCGYQALASFMHSPHDTLFLEAKALELVALQLKQLDYLTGKTPQKQSVDHHTEKISYACEILRKEMVSPPKLLALARRVGLNHNHLIRGFKEMFGLSPFEYLRAIRLEKARDLLASHECNVTEAAFGVGYSSLSHFTKTFQKEFGINPKAFAKKRKNKGSSCNSLCHPCQAGFFGKTCQFKI